MSTALLLIENAVPDPLETWPKLMKALDVVTTSLDVDTLRLTLVSNQELAVVDWQYGHAIELRLVSVDVFRAWPKSWAMALFDLLTYHVTSLSWYDDQPKPVLTAPKWHLDGCSGLIVIRSVRDEQIYAHYVLEANRQGLEVVRIDTDTQEKFRMKLPTKENSDG